MTHPEMTLYVMYNSNASYMYIYAFNIRICRIADMHYMAIIHCNMKHIRVVTFSNATYVYIYGLNTYIRRIADTYCRHALYIYRTYVVLQTRIIWLSYENVKHVHTLHTSYCRHALYGYHTLQNDCITCTFAHSPVCIQDGQSSRKGQICCRWSRFLRRCEIRHHWYLYYYIFSTYDLVLYMQTNLHMTWLYTCI